MSFWNHNFIILKMKGGKCAYFHLGQDVPAFRSFTTSNHGNSVEASRLLEDTCKRAFIVSHS